MSWKPDLTVTINAVLYWKGILKHKEGGKVGKEILVQHGLKAGIIHQAMTVHLPLMMLNNNLQRAIEHYKRVEHNPDCQKNGIMQLIEMQSTTHGLQKILWKWHVATEEQQTMSQRIKAITQDDQGQTGVLLVETTIGQTGGRQLVKTKQELE